MYKNILYVSGYFSIHIFGFCIVIFLHNITYPTLTNTEDILSKCF